MPNQVLCRADPDSRAKRERTGAGIRHNQSDIGNVMSFRPAKVSATVNWIQSEFPKIIPLWWTTDLRRKGFMYCDVRQWRHIRRRILEKGMDLPRKSGEAFAQPDTSFSNWVGLRKSSAECRRTGL